MTPEEGRKLNYLIHKVFAQNEDGRELLEFWKNSALVKAPTAQAGMDMLGVGIEEGKKTFIRNIILTIDQVEKE